MRKILNGLWILPWLIWGFGGCESEHVSFSGPEYVMFSDSAVVMPVFAKDTLFSVYVASTVAQDYDRNFAVEVVDRKSNAIEGVHYQLVNHNVTVKAGERAGVVTLKGIYDNIGPGDNLSICLKLVEDQSLKWDMYKDEINVRLVKCYPFDIEAFTGNIRMYATFPFSSTEVKEFLLTADKKNDKTLILREPFSRLYDIVLKFDDSDPMYPQVIVPSQVGFVDANYGKVNIRSVEVTPCFYRIPDRLIKLELEFYMPGIGSFGVHRIALEWISEEEADLDKNGII